MVTQGAVEIGVTEPFETAGKGIRSLNAWAPVT